MATARKSTADTSPDATTDGETAAAKAPRKTTTRRKTATKATAADDTEESADAEPEKKAAKRRATTSRTKKAAADDDADGAAGADAGADSEVASAKPAAKKVVRRRTVKSGDEPAEASPAEAREQSESTAKRAAKPAAARADATGDDDDAPKPERPARMTSYSSHGDAEEDEDPPPYRRGISRERDERAAGGASTGAGAGDRDRDRDRDRARDNGAGAAPREGRDDRAPQNQQQGGQYQQNRGGERGDRGDRGPQQQQQPNPQNQLQNQQQGGGAQDGTPRELSDKRRRWEERRQRRMDRRRERQMARINDGGDRGPQQQQQQQQGGGGYRDRYNDRGPMGGGQQQQGGGPMGGPPPQQQQGGGGDRYSDRYNERDRWDEYTPQGADDSQKIKLSMNELSQRSITELMELATELGIEAPGSLGRSDLIMRVLQMRAERSGNAYAVGVVDQREKEPYGFLRFADNDYLPSPNDVQITPGQMNKFSLRKGDEVAGIIRRPGKKERWWTLLKVDTVNDEPLEVHRQRTLFENLTPLYPEEKFNLEWNAAEFTTRVIDLMAPLGKGQRSMIVAPPRTGKTMIMQAIAKALEVRHPDAVLMVLLIDERPEEVTDMERTVKGEVISSTFDEPAERHVAIAEMTIERAKRMVEKGKDVVILMDSITRLARAYNLTVRQSGKLMSGGLDANALQRPKRFFGAARNIEEGGSLTIIATALIDTGSAMDQVIFEEFKGTGNNEINLYRPLAERRIFPAIDIHKSGTRKEELLLDEKSLQRVWLLRKALTELQPIETMEFLIERLKKAESNTAFLESVNG